MYVNRLKCECKDNPPSLNSNELNTIISRLVVDKVSSYFKQYHVYSKSIIPIKTHSYNDYLTNTQEKVIVWMTRGSGLLSFVGLIFLIRMPLQTKYVTNDSVDS